VVGSSGVRSCCSSASAAFLSAYQTLNVVLHHVDAVDGQAHERKQELDRVARNGTPVADGPAVQHLLTESWTACSRSYRED
jgi:hypothetical protein